MTNTLPLNRMWGRNLRIEFGKRGTLLKQLDDIGVNFNIEKNSEQQNHNPASIEIYNLTTNSREILAQTKECVVRIYVGYGDDIVLLYAGDVIKSNSVRESNTWVTKIEGGEGYTSFVSSEVNKTFSAGSSIADVIKYMTSTFITLNKGYMDELPSGAIPKAFTASGNTKDVLAKFLRKYDYEFLVNNGEYFVLKKGQTVDPNRVLLITGESGLVGSPENISVQSKKTKEEKKAIREAKKADPENYVAPINGIKFKTLINPQIRPGLQIKLESRQISGYFKVKKVVFRGSNLTSDWYAEVEAKKV